MEEDLELLEEDLEHIRDVFVDFFDVPKGLVFPISQEDKGEEKDEDEERN